MEPRLTVITLGVDDLERSVLFYRDLGLSTEGIVGEEFEHGAVAFLEMQPGLRLALWPRASIAHDTGLPVGPPSATEMTLGHNVRAREEVDAVMERAERCGARVVKPAERPSGAATPATFRIRTGTSGRSSGIRRSCPDRAQGAASRDPFGARRPGAGAAGGVSHLVRTELRRNRREVIARRNREDGAASRGESLRENGP